MKKIALCLVMSISLVSCAGGNVNKQGVGTGLGAIAGGLLGSTIGKGNGRTAAIVLGAIAGGVAGNAIGESLDRADQQYYNRTAQNSFETMPTGHASTWRNPDSGNWGTFTPTKTFNTSQGGHCREFSQKIVVGGKTREGFGTACRTPDGSWQIQ